MDLQYSTWEIISLCPFAQDRQRSVFKNWQNCFPPTASTVVHLFAGTAALLLVSLPRLLPPLLSQCVRNVVTGAKNVVSADASSDVCRAGTLYLPADVPVMLPTFLTAPLPTAPLRSLPAQMLHDWSHRQRHLCQRHCHLSNQNVSWNCCQHHLQQVNTSDTSHTIVRFCANNTVKNTFNTAFVH